MGSDRADIGSVRREQVVEAAVGIIAEQGIQKLSLSAIEERAHMARGHLTYYFPTKEDILLAVFDHLVETMRRRVGVTECKEFNHSSSWPFIEHLLHMILVAQGVAPTFAPLQYTFLAQMNHRADFRQRLAALYEQWRSNMSEGLTNDMEAVDDPPPFPPRALATFVQALLHGLAMQRAVDPDAFDREQVLELCLDVLGSYLRLRSPRPRARYPKSPAKSSRRKKNHSDRPTRE
ncbi:MAG TPA: TetR/AcrR family transcriptional regulator [Gemmataceae bacterium]|nr:TetR/AcrR family transcriptional regulator [Gemmataceae bacterium]